MRVYLCPNESRRRSHGSFVPPVSLQFAAQETRHHVAPGRAWVRAPRRARTLGLRSDPFQFAHPSSLASRFAALQAPTSPLASHLSPPSNRAQHANARPSSASSRFPLFRSRHDRQPAHQAEPDFTISTRSRDPMLLLTSDPPLVARSHRRAEPSKVPSAHLSRT